VTQFAGTCPIHCNNKQADRTNRMNSVGQVESHSEGGRSVRSRLRVGDKSRDRAAGVLQRAFTKGQLSKEEFDYRLALVFAAKVRNDLRPALEDLEEYQAVRSNPRLWQFWLD
jgi:hypothetical protein